ncbi:MAG: hypothetical protein GXO73_08475 [Calditrichaeota bacterium]|nr:hypothetical protein [Calditrichota bacterium]
MRNPYKRTDVFTCRHPSHARFNYRVSAYHVLKARRCYPNGCIVYRWRCHRFEKGQPCVRGFKHVGRLCVGCTHYRDTRMHYQPTVQLTPEAFKAFLEEVAEFDEWLHEAEGRRHEIYARVQSVRPLLRKVVDPKGERLQLNGYLVRLEDAFVGRTELEDGLYLALSGHQQERHSFRRGDVFECQATLRMSRGRLLIENPSRVEFIERGAREEMVSDPVGLIARLVATRVDESTSPRCVSCPYAALVDVEFRGQRRGRKRELYCLQGVADTANCALPLLEKLELEQIGFETCTENEV